MRDASTRPSDAPARVAPLSVLPVFLDLRDRPALVAGGTDAAAWKAELLAAAGARVTVAAAELGEEMARLAALGTVLHHPAEWDAALLTDCAIAIADCVEPSDAGAFAAAARAGATTVEAIGQQTRAGTNCGSCRSEIRELLHVQRLHAAE